jgi:glycosyltransferase involved in cell wall biosynthesis
MPRLIVFYYEWPNTAGNHSGMAYLVACLKKDAGFKMKLIRTPKNYMNWRELVKRLWRLSIIKYLKFILRPDDIFFFMEYINPSQAPGDHCAIALDLRKKRVNNKFIGLVHLPPKLILENLGEEYIHLAVSKVDKIVVMGSNLAGFFGELGCGNKVNSTFHYVDTKYYQPARQRRGKNDFVVFTSGYLYRNDKLLKEVIKGCPQVTFEMCMGFRNLRSMFSDCKNVIINGVLSEKEYLRKMQDSDISLSVFDDTVGSNVITTSLGCGLPQVVSDVGAIRDYCSEENAIFCKTVGEYVQAIYFLSQNREKCLQMGLSARKKAEEISLENSIRWYEGLFRSLA